VGLKRDAARTLTVTSRSYCPDMSSWTEGRSTVDYLLDRGKLEQLVGADAGTTAILLTDRAATRVSTSEAGLNGGDTEGAFVVAYDAYRISAESLLARQGLRATSGEGSHAVVEDAVSAQFAADVPQFAKPTFERFRRTRNALQYFDPTSPEVDGADAAWAISTATAAIEGVRSILDRGEISLYLRD